MTKRPKCPVAPVTTIIKTPFDGDDCNHPSDNNHNCTKYTIFNKQDRDQKVDAVLADLADKLSFIARDVLW